MNNELKPCPFCGGMATVAFCDGSGAYWTTDYEVKTIRGRSIDHCFAICHRCRIRTQPYLTRSGMRRAWNRRVNNE